MEAEKPFLCLLPFPLGVQAQVRIQGSPRVQSAITLTLFHQGPSPPPRLTDAPRLCLPSWAWRAARYSTLIYSAAR